MVSCCLLLRFSGRSGFSDLSGEVEVLVLEFGDGFAGTDFGGEAADFGHSVVEHPPDAPGGDRRKRVVAVGGVELAGKDGGVPEEVVVGVHVGDYLGGSGEVLVAELPPAPGADEVDARGVERVEVAGDGGGVPHAPDYHLFGFVSGGEGFGSVRGEENHVLIRHDIGGIFFGERAEVVAGDGVAFLFAAANRLRRVEGFCEAFDIIEGVRDEDAPCAVFDDRRQGGCCEDHIEDDRDRAFEHPRYYLAPRHHHSEPLLIHKNFSPRFGIGLLICRDFQEIIQEQPRRIRMHPTAEGGFW